MLAFTNKIGSRIFKKWYKTPFVAIIIIISTFTILFLSGYNMQINEYKEFKVSCIILKNDGIVIRFKADKVFIDKIQNKSKAFVFTADNSTRHIIYISDMKNIANGEHEVKIHNIKDNLLKDNANDLFIEFSVGKTKAITKIFNIRIR